MTSRPRIPRALAACALVTLGGSLALAACTADPAPAETTTAIATSPSPTPTPTPTSTTAQAEAAILATYDRFWNAVVEAERGNPDRALFDGIATGAVVEDEMTKASSYKENGIVVEGRPVISDVVVSVDGTTALVSSCVDESGWAPAGATSTLAPVRSSGVTFEQQPDGTWLATAWAYATPGSVPC